MLFSWMKTPSPHGWVHGVSDDPLPDELEKYLGTDVEVALLLELYDFGEAGLDDVLFADVV